MTHYETIKKYVLRKSYKLLNNIFQFIILQVQNLKLNYETSKNYVSWANLFLQETAFFIFKKAINWPTLLYSIVYIMWGSMDSPPPTSPSLTLRLRSWDYVRVCWDIYNKMERNHNKKVAKPWITTIAYRFSYIIHLCLKSSKPCHRIVSWGIGLAGKGGVATLRNLKYLACCPGNSLTVWCSTVL